MRARVRARPRQNTVSGARLWLLFALWTAFRCAQGSYQQRSSLTLTGSINPSGIRAGSEGDQR